MYFKNNLNHKNSVLVKYSESLINENIYLFISCYKTLQQQQGDSEHFHKVPLPRRICNEKNSANGTSRFKH